MKSLTRTIKYDSEDYTFSLEPISDIHRDDINFDAEKFEKVLKRIGADPGRYTLGLGDYGSSIYSYPNENRGTQTIAQEFKDNPEALYATLQSELSPIKHKIIGLLEGNHDYKIHQRGFYNWVKSLADDLGVRFLSYSAMINLKFVHTPTDKETNTKIYATHGRYTGAESSAAITKLKRVSSQIDADIYLMGDRHDLDGAKKAFLYIDNDGVIREGTKIFGLCGCFVRGYSIDNGDESSYPERMMLYPNRVGTITIAITPFTGRLNIHV